MSARATLDRSSHKIAGGLLFTAGAAILLGIITAEALYTAPYTTRTEISDLGATDAGLVLHPSSYIFNATMLVAGAMIIAGAWFTHQALHRRAVTIPTGLLGVGVLGVGIFPGNIHPWHPISAFTAFLAGGLAVLLSHKVTSQPLRTIFAIMGAISLLFTVASVFLLEWGRWPGWGWAGWSGGWSTRSCCGWSASAATWWPANRPRPAGRRRPARRPNPSTGTRRRCAAPGSGTRWSAWCHQRTTPPAFQPRRASSARWATRLLRDEPTDAPHRAGAG